MSCASASRELQEVVAKLMQEEGVTKYDIQVEGQSGKGENYMGDITFFSVVPREGENIYHLVMKTAHKSDEVRNSLPVEIAYERESYMYSEVFPAMRKFLLDTKSGINIDYIPRIYLLSIQQKCETIIMENLKMNGYKLWDRKKPMDLNHALFTMEKLGLHHGISLAMKSQKPNYFRNLTNDLKCIWLEFSSNMDTNSLYGPLIKNASKVLEEAGRTDLVTKFKHIENNISNIVFSENVDEDRIVICHGDFWNNNIMFKYENENDTRPSAISFVDFQVSQLDTPVKDLSYFIYSACDKPILDNLELLLKAYHNSLSRTVKALGSDPDDLFTYQQLKDHWKKYAAFGLVLSTLLVRNQLLRSEEAPDLANGKVEKDIANTFHVQMTNEDMYNKRLLDNFIHFGETLL